MSRPQRPLATLEGGVWRSYTPMTTRGGALPSIATGGRSIKSGATEHFPAGPRGISRPTTTGSISGGPSYLHTDKKIYLEGAEAEDSFILQPIQRPVTRMRPTSVMTASTQFAEKCPQIDVPQRIEPPLEFHAPRRATLVSVFGSSSNGSGKKDGERKAGRNAAKAPPKVHSHFRIQLRDFELLSRSSRRAGLSRGEASSMFNMGVLYDNLKDFDNAVKCYIKYLNLCQSSDDIIGTALAFNCIGVDLYYLAMQTTKGIEVEGRLRSAVQYHHSHLMIADKPGQFVAHCNLGLAYGRLVKYKEAKEHHKQAVRLALELQSAHGQSLALGNLALVEQRSGDVRAASDCMGQHLDLVKMLGDKAAQSVAMQELGKLANSKGEYEIASNYFTNSRSLAGESRESDYLSKSAKLQMGISMGNARMKETVESRAKISIALGEEKY